MIQFHCEHCGQRIKSKDEDVATTVQCPGCHRMLLVPAATQETSPPTTRADTGPSQARPPIVSGQSAVHSLRGVAAALALIATVAFLLFSIWAEWGPYAWIAAVQLALFHQYSAKITIVVTGLLFLIPILLLYARATGRIAKALYMGVLGSAAAVTFVATAYYMGTGDPSLESTSLIEAANSATYLPHNLSFKVSSLEGFDPTAGYRVRKSGSRSSGSEILYIPVALPEDPARPSLVYLAAERGTLNFDMEYHRETSGTIRYRPLPYLVRRAAPPDTSLWALVFTKSETVRNVWTPAIFCYLAAGLYFLKDHRHRRPIGGLSSRGATRPLP